MVDHPCVNIPIPNIAACFSYLIFYHKQSPKDKQKEGKRKKPDYLTQGTGRQAETAARENKEKTVPKGGRD